MNYRLTQTTTYTLKKKKRWKAIFHVRQVTGVDETVMYHYFQYVSNDKSLHLKVRF